MTGQQPSPRKGNTRGGRRARIQLREQRSDRGRRRAGYAGLHVALRLTAKLRNHSKMELTLVDRHDYHQVLTELPRVAGGTRAAGAVCIPLQEVLATRIRFA